MLKKKGFLKAIFRHSSGNLKTELFQIVMFDFKQSQVLNRYQPAKNSQRQIDSASRSPFITKLLGPIIARPGTAEKI